MPWDFTDKEIGELLTRNAAHRYEYWLKKVADEQVVWSLWQEGGWSLAKDDRGHELVPAWPHEKYANLCACDQWTGYVAKPIALDAWLERWIPGMTRDRRMVAIFPTPNLQGIPVEPSKLDIDLRQALEEYE